MLKFQNLYSRCCPILRSNLATNVDDFIHSLKTRRNSIPTSMIDDILKRSEITIDFNHYLEDETLNANCPIKHVYVNQLAANNPLEDRWNVGFTQVDGRVSSFLFTILDGHSGPSCGHALAWSLLDFVGASCLTKTKLESIMNYWKDEDQPFHIARRLELFGKGHIATPPPDTVRRMLTHNLKLFIEELLNSPDDSHSVPERMKVAMTRLDSIICNLGHADREKSLDTADFFRDFDSSHSKELVHLISSGAVGQVGRIFWGNDDASQADTVDFHLANVGDCSTYLFEREYNQPMLKSTSMNDLHQASVNPAEVDRIAKEHPNDSINQILRHEGRICGELAPSRSFGDVRYKWPAKRILQMIRLMNDGIPTSSSPILVGGPWAGYEPLPKPYNSPPYLTAEPDVKRVKLTRDSKYIVLATDGLWDMVSSDEVSQVLSKMPEGTSPATLLLRKALTSVPYNVAKVLQKNKKMEKEEISLQHAAALLSLPAGIARYYRDDITVMVIELDVKN